MLLPRCGGFLQWGPLETRHRTSGFRARFRKEGWCTNEATGEENPNLLPGLYNRRLTSQQAASGKRLQNRSI